MARVWYVTPSARPVLQARLCFYAWRDMGYAVAATRKKPDLNLDRLLSLPKYPGLWAATNLLARDVLETDPECEIVVTGGDDVFPDRTKRANEIADEFIEHFGGTLGVMQPVGGHEGWCDLAWSPWLGREWCRRSYGGLGPAWAEFWHYWGDAYLKLTAAHLGLWWLRPDLAQQHQKWNVIRAARPPHLDKSKEKWREDKELFERLRAAGLPGAELLSA